MDGTLITTTRNADLHSLATGGQRAIHAWDQIVGYVGRTATAAHAAIFAEPNQDPDRGTTDWYAQNIGVVQPFSSLSEAERGAATQALAALVTDIRAAARGLTESAREDERFLGEMLELALVTPGAEYLYVVGKQPVMVAWGHTLADAAAAPELLIGKIGTGTGRAASRPSRQPMTIVQAPVQVHRWPWRLLLGLLALAALLLLLPTLLIAFDPFGWLRLGNVQCVVAPQDIALQEEMRAEQQKEGRLREQIARVALDLGNRRVLCPPRVEAPPPAPQPRAADVDRADQMGGRRGKLQVILAWDDRDDLDLAVLCPGGGVINYNQRNACGGSLDVDRNSSPPLVTDPVENVVFAQAPGAGRYRFFVHKYDHRSGSPAQTPYRVTVRQEGQPDKVFTGSVGPNQRVEVGHVDIP